ncbi:MAG: cytochrome c biogenesis protein CcdA [Niabella sp.]
MKIISLFYCIVSLFPLYALGQPAPVIFSTEIHLLKDGEAELIITARMEKGIALYALQPDSANGLGSTILFDTATVQYLDGAIQVLTPATTITDSVLGQVVSVYRDSSVWKQKLKGLTADSQQLKATIQYLYQQGDAYLPGDTLLKISVPALNRRDAEDNTSLLWIFIAAFGGGLLALLTPCVYSMIPVTVSFFTKRSNNKKEGIRNALYYSLSIIFIFTLLGFLITLIFGPAALNNLATNWIANLIFFAIFLIFGFSFLGAFEIALPASWAGKADSKAGTQNFWGIFFMALTLVLVSFSCTGPIIGNLLVLAAKGSYYGPLTGMFGFSLALALPFALFAFFPSKLNVLGKAGGWLNAVKVTLGFVELALALKFLSNADLARNWRILDREIFIVLWIAIFGLLGVYLLGKIKFRHDDALPQNDFGLPFLSVTRLLFTISAFSMTIYLLPGLFGAPLKGLGAFLPPMGTQDFNADDLPSGFSLTSLTQSGHSNGLPEPKKYASVMKKNEPDVVVNNGLVTYFDYNEALEVARNLKRPLLLDFTGINCINCRKMEAQVWSDPQVMRLLKDSFVIASLFVDVHKDVDLPASEQYYSKELGKDIVTLGDRNAEIQVRRFGSNTQPFYFFLDGNQQKLVASGYGYDPDIKKFKNLLQQVLLQYHKD